MNQGSLTFDETSNTLSWAVAQRAKFQQSGDGYVVLRDGNTIFAIVIDGIGSGLEAHRAASLGLDALQKLPQQRLKSMFDVVHQTLHREARGAAMGVAAIDMTDLSVAWAAIGDVDGLLIEMDGERASLVQKPGTLGNVHPGIAVTRHSFKQGALITLVTDGVRSAYRSMQTADAPDIHTRRIIDEYGRSNDDCLALSIRVEAA